MARPIALVAAVAVPVLALSSCAETGLNAADAYRVGCPALDAVAASGTVVGKVALAGLQQLKDSGTVTGESEQWLDVAIQFLDDPDSVSPEAKKMIRDRCAEQGYELRNLD